MTLEPHPYRASGSHQLNIQQFRHVLGSNVVAKYRPSIIYLVDLRQETHGFLDDIAYSWYADNDFGNVGQPLDWIVNEEKIRLLFLEALTKARVFEIATDSSDNRAQQRMIPTSYQDIAVGTARTEEQAFDDRKIGSPHLLDRPVCPDTGDRPLRPGSGGAQDTRGLGHQGAERCVVPLSLPRWRRSHDDVPYAV